MSIQVWRPSCSGQVGTPQSWKPVVGGADAEDGVLQFTVPEWSGPIIAEAPDVAIRVYT